MSFDRDRWQHACIYIWTNKIAGSTSRVEESSMLVSSTGAVGGRLQHPVWIRRDLIMEEVHGISNSIPFVADISMESLHQHVNCLHHYGVEGTTACQGSSWIHSIRRQRSNRSHISTDRMEEKMEESIPDWSRRVDDQKHPQKSSVFQ